MATLIYLTLTATATPEAHAEAAAWHRQMLLVEGAGVFWIAAELAILFGVLVARRHISECPHEARVALTSTEKRRLCWGIVGVIGLFIAVFGRHWLVSPLQHALSDGAGPEELLAAYALRMWIHQGVWFVFITAWVLLEAAIVYHGVRAYRHLLELYRNTGHPPLSPHDSPGSGAVLTLAVAAGASILAVDAAVEAANAGLAAWEATLAEMQPLVNAMGLYLRVAGVVWITVEWVAAFYIWRGCRLLRAWISRGEGVLDGS